MKKTKNLLAIVAMMLLVAMLSVAGTMAWLTAETVPVKNTFTVGDINIKLDEHDYAPESNNLDMNKLVKENKDYKIIPGTTLPKDPFVTVEGGSEACWLFVKIETALPNEGDISWGIADGWTALSGAAGVYYKEVAAATGDQLFAVLKNNQIVVSGDLTKAEADDLANSYTMTITAYAVQKENVATAADAWAKLNPTTAG